MKCVSIKKKEKKVHTYGQFLSSPHVVGAGKAPPSHVSSEGGVWQWHYSGQGVFNTKKALNKVDK